MSIKNKFKKILFGGLVALVLAGGISCNKPNPNQPEENNRTEENSPPNAPIISGPTSGYVDSIYTFKVSAYDPDEDSLCYKFDFGDNNISESKYVKNNTEIKLSHSYKNKGDYQIKVQAKDTKGNTSNWSNPYKIVINKPIETRIRIGIDAYKNNNASPDACKNGHFTYSSTWTKESLNWIMPAGMRFVQPWFQVYALKSEGYGDIDNIEVKVNGVPVQWEGYKCESIEGWMIEHWHDNDPYNAGDDGPHECIYPANDYLSIVPGFEDNVIRVAPDSAEWSMALIRYQKVPAKEKDVIDVSIYYKLK